MELYRPRSSSIPRHYRKIPAHERFTVTDAAQLKLKLQALNDKLDPNVSVETLRIACQSRPFHEEIYVDGSEEFFLLVKGIPRADLIPDVYIEAYDAVQHGHFPVNHYKVSDFSKGVDPTFSQVRAKLGEIDELCDTKLDESFRSLLNQVTPFPFLRLPTELRLQVYANLIPRESHIAMIHQPLRDHKPPRVSLALARTNHQLHHEVTKFFYERRTLFMIAARDRDSPTLSDEYMSRYYETLATMNPQTRQLFTRMEIQVGYLTDQDFTARRHVGVASTTTPLRHIFALLPNIDTVIVTFIRTPTQPLSRLIRIMTQRTDTVEWILEYLPQQVDLFWGKTSVPKISITAEDARMWSMLNQRGPVRYGESVGVRLEREILEKKRVYVYEKLGAEKR